MSGVAAAAVGPPTLRVDGGLAAALRPEALRAIDADALVRYLTGRRWFGAKGERARDARIIDAVALPGSAAALARVEVEGRDGSVGRYLLPLSVERRASSGEDDGRTIAFVESRSERGAIIDATEDPAFRTALGEALSRGAVLEGNGVRWVAECAGSGPSPLDARRSTLLSSEQSNTSIVYGDQAILKIFRRLEPGEHPDAEVSRFLAGQPGGAVTPAFLGELRVEDERGASVAGMLQRLVPDATDAWRYAVNAGRGKREDGSDELALFADDARRLGATTRALHEALASDPDHPDFAPRPAGAADVARWAEKTRRSIESALALLGRRLAAGALPSGVAADAEAVLARREALLARPAQLAALVGDDVGASIRHHGDYHLGQVLRSPDGELAVIDFEGEPARSLAERRERHSALRDVAGMLRSFAYAAATRAAASGREVGAGPAAERAARWEHSARSAFLDGYFAAHEGRASFLPRERAHADALVALFELEKTFYELSYELNNRPDWAWIPLRGATTATPWTLERGATVVGEAVRFSVWAPSAERASVRVSAGGREAEHRLEPRGGGVFDATVPGVRAGADYRYVLDGDRALPDPVSRHQPEGVHGPSRVVDPRAFRWGDGAWRGLAMAEYVIYELHVGTFTDAGTFDAVIPRLAELRELGVTAIEIMPVAEFPGGRNWGYDGVHPYAPQSSYGGPDGLRRLVNAAHAAGLAVVLDVVYNHLGPEGNYLGAYGPYRTETYRTPWGPAMNYDGADSGGVRRYVIDNALYWVTEFHVDALRLDAIHGIYDFGTTHVLRELAEAVHAQGARLGRTAVVIGESDLNDPRVVRPSGDCGHGLDAQWADDLHHAIHAALTGESNGYYADFGGTEPVAQALAHPYVYAGGYSAHRRRRHGAPATGVSNDHFVVAVQNHDQVGNRAAGDRLATLVPPERQRLAAALLLLSPYVPLLFMGEEYGETNPFLYFVSHGDPALVEAVRAGRRKEFASFGWGDGVPDPQAEDTFLRSKLDWSRRGAPGHAALLALYRDLLRLRAREPALRPGAARVQASGGPNGVIRMTLTPTDGAPLAAHFNLSAAPQTIVDELDSNAARAARWRRVLTTTDAKYGGTGDGPDAELGGAAGARPILPPFSAVVYREEPA